MDKTNYTVSDRNNSNDERKTLEEYIRLANEIPDLQAEKEYELFEKCRQGDKDARNELVEAYLKLVIRVAMKLRYMGVPLIDLINSGNVGLLKAVDKFDHTKGAGFASYAYWYIRQSIYRDCRVERPIRIPPSQLELTRNVHDTARRLLYKNGCEPSDEEIAEELSISPDLVRKVLDMDWYTDNE